MIRWFVIGALALSLTACGKPYTPVRSTPAPADVPDAALVAPCDQTNADPADNLAMVLELRHNRRQRDDCAAQVDALRQWRTDALKRALLPEAPQ